MHYQITKSALKKVQSINSNIKAVELQPHSEKVFGDFGKDMGQVTKYLGVVVFTENNHNGHWNSGVECGSTVKRAKTAIKHVNEILTYHSNHPVELSMEDFYTSNF